MFFSRVKRHKSVARHVTNEIGLRQLGNFCGKEQTAAKK
jgi:hypothetical protein